ncbi:MAG: NAD(P)/FAD-dependent oxidoreductase [Candidatus Saccharibacteria bacterium]
MKVAIIGAGVSGLSCAHELERHGIYPTIYERKSFIGDIETHVIASLEIISRPIRDWVTYAWENYDLFVTPLNRVKKITHKSPNKITVLKGNLGYFFKRDREPDSLLKQIHSQLNHTKIVLNEYADYRKLHDEYDYVVIANGQANYVDELGCWHERATGWVKGAVVLGDFDPTELIIWVNKDYSNKGYAYLTPFSDKQASICLFVPYTKKADLSHYWELFLYTEKIKYTIIEEFQVRHTSGFVHPAQYDKYYFAGMAGGAVDPFLGFGAVKSVFQGIYAAQSIATGQDYSELIKGITQKTQSMWEMRLAFNKAKNDDYDLIFTAIGIPGLQHLIYKTPINILNMGGKILRFRRMLGSRGSSD